MTDINIKSMEKRKIGIYAVLDKHKDLTKRMSEDARYNLTKSLAEADEELDPNEEPQDDIEGGLDLGPDQQTAAAEPEPDQPAEDDDALDLDALAGDDDEGEGGMGDEQMPPAMPDSPPSMDMGAPADTSGEPTEEIDVTQFVEKGNELTQKVDSQVQAMSQQIDALTQKLSSMDQLLSKIQQVEDEIHAMRPPKPIETLKLRSLDSYPYNQGIDDYWKQKEIEIEKLRDFNRVDNQEYVLTNDDVNNFSDIEIRDSFKPNNGQSVNSFTGPQTNQAQPSRFNRQQGY